MYHVFILLLAVLCVRSIASCKDKDPPKNLPTNFDSRTKWPQCESIKEIRDQGQCLTCWAISAVQVITDRYCIHSKNLKIEKSFHFSTFDVICSSEISARGCNETEDASQVWQYWINTGIVSGGEYNSKEGCKPYPYPPGGDRYSISGGKPKCKKECEKYYSASYEADKRKGRSFYYIQRNESQTMVEIYKNGPVQAHMQLYSDLNNYTKGVYQHRQQDSDSSEKWHSVRIIGWGEEKGVKYWLCANSWGTQWGEGGFFRTLRGENHCDIERLIYAGLPKYPKRRNKLCDRKK